MNRVANDVGKKLWQEALSVCQRHETMSTSLQFALASLFLAGGALLTVATGVVQLRGAFTMLAGLSRHRARAHAEILQSAGIGAVIAGPLCLWAAGPGAIAWLWVGMFAAMAMAYAEKRLMTSAKGEPADASPLRYMRLLPTPLRVGLIGAYALAACAAYLLLGGGLASQQASTTVSWFLPDHGADAARVTGLVLLVLLLAPRKLRERFGLLVGLLLNLFVLALVWILASDFEATQTALNEIIVGALPQADAPASAGLVGSAFVGVIFVGLSKSLLASDAGSGGTTYEEFSAPHQAKSSVLAMWPPLILGGVVATLCALAIQVGGLPARERIDAPEFRLLSGEVLADEGDTELNAELLRTKLQAGEIKDPLVDTLRARLVPLERKHARKLQPTQVGQSFALPVDSPLEAGKHYPFILRSDPRGEAIGQLTPKGNGLAVARPWQMLRETDTVVFREKDPELAKHSGFDVRVPVDVVPLGDAVSPRAYAFTPKDPRYDLIQLARRMKGPYVVLRDFEIDGVVLKMESTDPSLKAHLGVVQHEDPNAPPNPTLGDIVGKLSFRGPYLATYGNRRPSAFVGREGLDFAIGQKIPLEMLPSPRGLDIRVVLTDGSIELPPWRFLMDADTLVMRHKTDPTLDIHLRATALLSANGRIRFHSVDESFPPLVEMKHLAQYADYDGPYVLAPSYEFEVEAHSGLHLPDAPGTPTDELNLTRGRLANRLALIPLHEQNEAIGRSGPLYDPHPGEILATNMTGPFRVTEGSSSVLRLLREKFGEGGALAGLLFLVALSVHGGNMAIRKGMRLASAVFGRGTQFGFAVVAVGLACVASSIRFASLVGAAEICLWIAGVANLVALCLFLPEVLRRSNKS